MRNTKYYIGLDVHKEHASYVVRNKIGNILLEGKSQPLHRTLPGTQILLTTAVIELEASTSYYSLYQIFLND